MYRRLKGQVGRSLSAPGINTKSINVSYDESPTCAKFLGRPNLVKILKFCGSRMTTDQVLVILN